MTITDVAKELRLDWHAVKTLEKEYMEGQLRRNPVAGPRTIGIDELSLRKGHTYRIVVSDLERGRPIWYGGEDRSEHVLDDEEQAKAFRFSYQDEAEPGERPGPWRLHHASAMGPVRWTNIHDASEPLSSPFGDVVSGPLSDDFGPGVVGVKVKIRRNSRLLRRSCMARLLTHTLYWSLGKPGARREARNPPESGATPDHVLALREAINVLDDPAVEERLLARAIPPA